MDTNTCIRTKRDSRSYKDQAIGEEELKRILEAGRLPFDGGQMRGPGRPPCNAAD